MKDTEVEMSDMSDNSKSKSNQSPFDSQNQDQSNSPSIKITREDCMNILIKIGFVIVILLSIYVIISVITSIIYLFYLKGVGIPEPPCEKVKISYSNNDDVRFKLGDETYGLEVVDNMMGPLYPLRQTYYIGSDDNKKKVNFQKGKSIRAYEKDGKYYTHYACVLEQNYYKCEDLTTSFIAFALDKITVLFGISLINALIVSFILAIVLLINFLGGSVVYLLAMCIRALGYYVMCNEWPRIFWFGCDGQQVNHQHNCA